MKRGGNAGRWRREDVVKAPVVGPLDIGAKTLTFTIHQPIFSNWLIT
jgi:hypothetical protein